MTNRILLITLIGIMTISCDSSKLKKTPIEDFEGQWELCGREMYNGIVVQIEKNEKNEFSGKVIQLNEDKYVKMFVNKGDLWITQIKRSSNYEFQITEKKIASQLFSLYGQKTTHEFNVQFIDKNTFGLESGTSDPTESTILYKRIVN